MVSSTSPVSLTNEVMSPSDLNTAPQPYPYQVGGHGQLVQASNGTVLKPLVVKEAAFYELMHSDKAPQEARWLRKYIPNYFGRLRLRREGEEQPDDPSHPSDNPTQDATIDNVVETSKQIETPVKGGHGSDRGSMDRPARLREPVKRVLGHAANAAVSGKQGNGMVANGRGEKGQMSPWAAAMVHRYLPKAADPNLVLVMEDLNAGYKHPCVMDVKIGLRHYDDDASADKKRRHRAKAESTTTGTTGLRIIGQQCYKVGHGFCYRDKYDGRRYKEEDLVPETRWFFHNGTLMRDDCVRLVLIKLREFAQHMEQQTQFSFYSTSLLIVYEGDFVTGQVPRVDVRMIDFAHTKQLNGTRPDDGYMFGLRYLIGVLERVLDVSGATDALASASSPAAATTTTAATTVGQPVAAEALTQTAARASPRGHTDA